MCGLYVWFMGILGESLVGWGGLGSCSSMSVEVSMKASGCQHDEARPGSSNTKNTT